MWEPPLYSLQPPTLRQPSHFLLTLVCQEWIFHLSSAQISGFSIHRYKNTNRNETSMYQAHKYLLSWYTNMNETSMYTSSAQISALLIHKYEWNFHVSSMNAQISVFLIYVYEYWKTSFWNHFQYKCTTFHQVSCSSLKKIWIDLNRSQKNSGSHHNNIMQEQNCQKNANRHSLVDTRHIFKLLLWTVYLYSLLIGRLKEILNVEVYYLCWKS